MSQTGDVRDSSRREKAAQVVANLKRAGVYLIVRDGNVAAYGEGVEKLTKKLRSALRIMKREIIECLESDNEGSDVDVPDDGYEIWVEYLGNDGNYHLSMSEFFWSFYPDWFAMEHHNIDVDHPAVFQPKTNRKKEPVEWREFRARPEDITSTDYCRPRSSHWG